MRPGDEITVEPIELVAGGDALAKVDGLPIFVAGIYPGDVARVRIVEAKKGFARAALVELVAPSPLRRAVPCPIAGECGGCDWTALRLDAQLAAKERILRESLRRIGKLHSLPPIALHPSPLNYRLRSRLHADGGAVGFYAPGSHRVVPLAKECEVVGEKTAAVIASEAKQSPAKETDRVASLAMTGSWEIDGRLITGEQEISIDVQKYHFRLHTNTFFQVNRHLLATMLRLVREHAERTRDRRRAIDLYSGVGFFSAPLGDVFDRVIAVEGSGLSHRYARLNATKGIEPVYAAVEAWVQKMPRSAFVFLDPPRSGAKGNVIDAVAAKATETICFLACDPVTFARDANRLTASGWRLAALDLLDLFPNTHHVETLARFERAT